jgi:DNA-binding NarL/FixJ family response regulator
VARILLVDDERQVIQGWRMRLNLEPDMVVVGEASTADSALRLARETQPDVILLDIKLPNKNGITIIRHLYELAPACKVIIVTLYDSPYHRTRAHEAGAVALIAKQESPERLFTAIREAVHPDISAEQEG